MDGTNSSLVMPVTNPSFVLVETTLIVNVVVAFDLESSAISSRRSLDSLEHSALSLESFSSSTALAVDVVVDIDVDDVVVVTPPS